jgi:hypothetical protein
VVQTSTRILLFTVVNLFGAIVPSVVGSLVGRTGIHHRSQTCHESFEQDVLDAEKPVVFSTG